MVEQAPVDDKEDKPDDKPQEAAPLTTNNVGKGDDGFGLKAGTGGNYLGGTSAARRSKWGWYAAQVQMTVADSLRKNPHTRSAALSLKVRIWPDITGRVTRAKLAETTSDPKLDAAINESLIGLQLKEAPPEGMPTPIVLRITAQRPN